MPWDLNQINNAFMANLPDPAGSFQAGQDEAQARQYLAANNQIALQQKQIALARQVQKQEAVRAAIANPSPKAFADLQAIYPEDREAFKASWETRDADARKTDLGQISAIRGYLKSGLPDKAATLLQSRIDADKAAGQPTQEDEQFLDAIRNNPTQAAGYADYLISMIPDAEKGAVAEKSLAEAATINANRPGLVAEQTAKAAKAQTEAEFAPKVIQSDLDSEASTREKQKADIAYNIGQLAVAKGRLALDVDRLATETQVKLQQLDQQYGQLGAAPQKLRDDAVISAGVNYGLANRAKDLADSFAVADIGNGGWGAYFREAYKDSFGGQNAVSGLRQAYDALVNSQAVKNLPPGPASDKDIELAKKGFPDRTANKGYIVSFLRGMEKMQRFAGENDDRRAAWISANGNGSLGPARQDMEVDGYLVKKGTQFNQFNRLIGGQSKGPSAAMTALEGQYGAR